MDFRKELLIKPFKEQIQLDDLLFLCGSCFSENLGAKLAAYHFRTLVNPYGILFNPISIVQSLQNVLSNKNYTPEDIFYHEGLWKSWNHHSQFSGENQDKVLQSLNHSNQKAHKHLQQSRWLILTLGSAWVYSRENGEVVANCHKIPTDKFKKSLLSVSEIGESMEQLLQNLEKFNPNLRVIFTISPVRHLRDGYIENNWSKAVLIQSVHEIVNKYSGACYFPSYELIIDDLRDYRFYAEDMVHPNYLATDYIWEKFQLACIDEKSRTFFPDINRINAAKAHKAFQPASEAHRKFRQKNLELVRDLQHRLPFLDWQHDLHFFSD